MKATEPLIRATATGPSRPRRARPSPLQPRPRYRGQRPSLSRSPVDQGLRRRKRAQGRSGSDRAKGRRPSRPRLSSRPLIRVGRLHRQAEPAAPAVKSEPKAPETVTAKAPPAATAKAPATTAKAPETATPKPAVPQPPAAKSATEGRQEVAERPPRPPRRLRPRRVPEVRDGQEHAENQPPRARPRHRHRLEHRRRLERQPTSASRPWPPPAPPRRQAAGRAVTS